MAYGLPNGEKGPLLSLLPVMRRSVRWGVHTGEPFEKDALGDRVEVQIAKRNELKKFEVVPKRWVVERSFAWLEKCRRLWKNCERKLNTNLQFVYLAFLTLLLTRS